MNALSRLFRRRRPPKTRRLRLTSADERQLRRGALLAHPDGSVEAILTFGDGGPAYAARLDDRLARRLIHELRQAMDAIVPLVEADLPKRLQTRSTTP